MATVNAVGNSLTGSTGTVNFVGSTSPTLVTPRIGTIADTTGASGIVISPAGTAVNYMQVLNGNTGSPVECNANGSDTDISFIHRTKGAGIHQFVSAAANTSFIIFNGTSSQHQTNFSFANTAANRTVTWPDADGTVAFTSGASGIVNSGTQNQLAWYAATGTTVSGLSSAANGVLVTSAGSVPSISSTLPSGIAATSMSLTTPSIGVATGTSFNTITGVATQAEQETATSIVQVVTPGRQQYHPSASKAWADFTGTGTPALVASYNMTSITDGGVGLWTLNFTVAMSTADFCAVTVGDNSIASASTVILSTATGSVGVRGVRFTDNASVDLTNAYVACFGDQ